MNELDIGSIKLPLSSVTRTFAISAKRGAGKTYTAAVLAEEFFRVGIPFIIIDPIDVWWGLRLSANGKDKGLPVVIFGIENADIKLDKDMGRIIAQEIVKKNISCVISTFGMSKAAQRHLVAEFSDELLRINNTPRHVFIEEAHEYLPQRVFGGLGVVFNSCSNLVVMGRNRGIGVSLINQRAATINKDVLTQIDTLIALRNLAPQDRKALKEWVEAHSAEGDFEKFMSSLPSLPTGEAWVWSPEFLDVFERVKIRPRTTFHPDREKLGIDFSMPIIEQGDVEEFIRSFPKGKQTPVQGKPAQSVTSSAIEMPTMQQIKNEYEAKLIQKDIEIRQLKEAIDRVRAAVGFLQAPPSQFSKPVVNDQINMWLEKLGNGGAAKIFKFLVERPNLSFTREQLALAVGATYNSITNVWVPLLKRNLLINEEGRKLKLNPSLFGGAE